MPVDIRKLISEQIQSKALPRLEAYTGGMIPADEPATPPTVMQEYLKREGAPFIRDHIIRVTEHAFDDFAGAQADRETNRRLLGL